MPGNLGSFPLFAGLQGNVLDALASRAVTKTYPRNAIIVNEGDRSDSFYIIRSGKVKVYVSDENGREVVLGVEGPGDYFGEMVLDGGPWSASVMTLEPTALCINYPEAGFPRVAAHQPGLRD